MKRNTHSSASSIFLGRVRLVRRSQALGTMAALLVVLALPLHAAVITGNFDGLATLTSTGTPGIFTQNFTGAGYDTTFGSFAPSSQSTIDFSNPPQILISNGKLLETFANGTLLGDSSGTGTASGHGTATFTINLVITGGTGIFTGDTGTATITGTITQTSPSTESISASYTGTLAPVPEPSTVVPLATLLIGFVLRQRNRFILR